MNIEVILKSVKYIIIGAIILLILYFFNSYASLKADKLLLINQKTHLELLIDHQNETLLNMRLEIKEYKEQEPKVVEKIITKYKNIEVEKNASCEEVIKKIEQAVGVFYDK